MAATVKVELAEGKGHVHGFCDPVFQPVLDAFIANFNEGEEQGASISFTVDGETVGDALKNLVEQAYLRTLSRYPDTDEVEISVDYIEQSETPADGVASLLWALVNTKEFIITH